MKRFLLFVGSDYYPNGGADDLYEDFEDLADAEDLGEKLLGHNIPCGFKDRTWYHVLDTETGRKYH